MSRGISLGRSNLRDVILILSCISAWFFPVSPLKIGVSLGLLGAGCCLHLLVKGVLIRNTVLCKDGIYKFTRHPYYTSNYLIDISFCLLSGNTYLVLAYPFLFFWAYGPTLKKEEHYLASEHETQFFPYALETAQVLPDAVSMSHWKEFLKGFSTSRISSREIARIMRFCIGAAFVLLIHDVRKEGLNELLPMRANDYGAFLYLCAIVILSAAQFVMLRRAKNSLRSEGRSG